MGVWGLTTFLEDKPEVWEDLELSDTRLIIDGNALYAYLYYAEEPPLDYVHCGQYREYVERVKSFFGKLAEHRITPYVVMNGVREGDKKLQTTIARIERYFGDYGGWANWFNNHGEKPVLDGLPSLARVCFVETLQEMEVEVATADQ